MARLIQAVNQVNQTLQKIAAALEKLAAQK